MLEMVKTCFCDKPDHNLYKSSSSYDIFLCILAKVVKKAMKNNGPHLWKQVKGRCVVFFLSFVFWMINLKARVTEKEREAERNLHSTNWDKSCAWAILKAEASLRACGCRSLSRTAFPGILPESWDQKWNSLDSNWCTYGMLPLWLVT